MTSPRSVATSSASPAHVNHMGRLPPCQIAVGSSEGVTVMPVGDVWRGVLLVSCFLQAGLVFGTLRSFGVFFPELVEYFDSAAGSVSWVTSCSVAVQQLMSPLGCALSSRFGFRPVIMTGGLLSALGMFCASFATSLYHLYLSIGVMSGLGWAFIFSPSMAAVTQYFSRHRSLATGFVLTGVGLLSFAMSPVLQYLIETYSWRGAMLLLSGIALHSVPCGALLTPRPHAETQTFVWGWELLSNWSFMRYCLAITFINVGYFVPFAHLVAHMQAKGAGDRQAAFIMALVGMTDVGGRLFAGWLSDLIPQRIILLLSMWTGVTAMVLALLPLARGLVEMGITAAAFGFCAGALTPGVFSALPAVVGEHKVLPALGLLQMIESGGGLVGAPISGWLRDLTGSFALSFVISGLFFLLGAVILLTLPGICFTCPTDKRRVIDPSDHNTTSSSCSNKSQASNQATNISHSPGHPQGPDKLSPHHSTQYVMCTSDQEPIPHHSTHGVTTKTDQEPIPQYSAPHDLSGTDQNLVYNTSRTEQNPSPPHCSESASSRTTQHLTALDYTKPPMCGISQDLNLHHCPGNVTSWSSQDWTPPHCTKHDTSRANLDLTAYYSTERATSMTNQDLVQPNYVENPRIDQHLIQLHNTEHGVRRTDASPTVMLVASFIHGNTGKVPVPLHSAEENNTKNEKDLSPLNGTEVNSRKETCLTLGAICKKDDLSTSHEHEEIRAFMDPLLGTSTELNENWVIRDLLPSECTCLLNTGTLAQAETSGEIPHRVLVPCSVMS
uniref:Solute carrier family 16 member 13 n=1 Tax=Leptobrachium leishanense TaxID=445787 RepID=A0A8C5MGQ1_9ANUR